jgi:hypothetical protein
MPNLVYFPLEVYMSGFQPSILWRSTNLGLRPRLAYAGPSALSAAAGRLSGQGVIIHGDSERCSE